MDKKYVVKQDYYDGAPIIPEEIKKMSIEELDAELKKLDKIRKLLEKYYKLFPNDGLFPEWIDIPTEEKIEMLKEAIKDKKDLTQTKLFEKYEEKVINSQEEDNNAK